MVLGDKDCKGDKILGGGFIFYFHPYLGEDFQFDEHIFQMGWFNHQPEDDEIRISLVAIFDKKKASPLTTSDDRTLYKRRVWRVDSRGTTTGSKVIAINASIPTIVGGFIPKLSWV